MKFSLRPFFIALFLVLAGIQPSFAFKLVPISRTFSPVGANATQSYEIVNDGPDRLAVSVSMVQRQMDLDGKEQYKDADDDFLIYPPQILLEPGATQTVRVTWVGQSNPSKELAYRLVAEQLPIDLNKPQDSAKKANGNIKVLLRYAGSVYVRPDNVKPNVVLESVEPQANPQGANQLALTFSNQGTAHVALRDLRLELKSAQGTVVQLGPEQLKGVNNTVILAGNKRRFVIPYPAGLSQGPVTATFQFNQRQ